MTRLFVRFFVPVGKGGTMSHSWLYDRQDQLDGYKAFARIAYTLRRHVLPEDRDDIEMDIILKLRISVKSAACSE